MNSSHYMVSILVPVYGVERYIEKCARSLFEQDYDNLEFVFVDDCGPDKSIEVLMQVLQDYPNRKEQVRIIKHDKNRGLAAARNTAVRCSCGAFLIHCDSDDWLDRKAISQLVARQEQTEADIVSGKACAVYAEGTKVIEEPSYQNREVCLLDVLNVKKPLYHTIWRRLFRSSLYRDNHVEAKEGINQGEDLQVTPQLIYYSSRVAEIDEVVYYYNCTNQTSYCHQLEKNPRLWTQDLTSYDVLQLFFEDKEEVFRDAVAEMVVYI